MMRLFIHRRRRGKGIALISVLLILVIMFIISTGFIQMITQDAKVGMGQYQSNLSMMLADSGLEYGLFMIRHNCFIRPDASSLYPYYSNIVISELTYPASTGTSLDDAFWLKAQGRFNLYLDSFNTTSNEITLRSEGEVTRSTGDVLHRRTAYAVISVGTPTMTANSTTPGTPNWTNTGTLRVQTWYEKWR
jgi:hypothetical protein